MQPLTSEAPITDCISEYLRWMAQQNYALRSIDERRKVLGYFLSWCVHSGLVRISHVDRTVIEGWQRHLHEARKRCGNPLSVGVQHNRLIQLQAFFGWLIRTGIISSNPASHLCLPRISRRLPMRVLSVPEIESILRLPDIHTPEGLRDRVILELFWSTGIRRQEAAQLTTDCIDWHRRVLQVRQGKGDKDRVLPLGRRAMHWLRRYLDARREAPADAGAASRVFLGSDGAPFNYNSLGNLVHRYIAKAGITTGGSCHLFRHSMATAMLDHGADIRYVQEMLGHQRLETTQIYTHVSIEKLRAVHHATHPAERFDAGDNPGDGTSSSETPTAEWMLALRVRAGLDRPAAAHLLGISTGTLARLESGRSSPRGSLRRLLQLLQRHPSILLQLHDVASDP
jgi:integrase/recombinase XerD